MKPRFLIVLLIGFTTIGLLFNASCTKKKQDVPNVEKLPDAPVAAMLLTSADSVKMKADSLLGKSTPVMGYRFVIWGDFDGDHVSDTLFERYTDSLYQKEVPKYYNSIDTTFEYSDVLFLNSYLGHRSFIEWKLKKLRLPGGQLGFHYMENCGDVNDDGKDELMLVNQWGDYSNCNSAHFYTYENGEWEEIYTTPVWEWQFPPTPFASMAPGLFGNFDYGTIEDFADNVSMEGELKAFRFVNHYPDHSIEFNGMNDIGVNSDDAAGKELEEIGDFEYLEKYFTNTILNDSAYFGRKDNPSIYYKAAKYTTTDNTAIYMLPLDDGASDVTTRIYIKHPHSPFKKKRHKG
jgi:hypothetical protein